MIPQLEEKEKNQNEYYWACVVNNFCYFEFLHF